MVGLSWQVHIPEEHTPDAIVNIAEFGGNEFGLWAGHLRLLFFS